MSFIKDTFFGGAEKKAAQAQQYNYEQAQQQIKEATDRARSDIMSIFPQQYQNIVNAYSQAGDLISQGKGNASNILQQAFSNANQTLQSGNEQVLSALLGRPSQMQLPQQAPQGMFRASNQPYQQTVVQNAAGVKAGTAPTMTQLDPRMLQNTGGMMNPNPIGGGDYGIAIQDPRTQGLGGIQTPIQQQPQGLGSAPDLGQAQQVAPVNTSGIGLSGAEQALQGGMQAQTGALTGQNMQAQNTLQQTLGGQLGALQQGFGGAEQAINQYGAQALGAANQGYGQARQDIGNTLGMMVNTIGQGLGALQAGENRALGRIDQFTRQAVNTLNPYAQTGQAALGQEAALSGALGGQAQQDAINQFMESPAQKFLREQGEKALTRNAAATGGLRSGSTLAALQDRGIGVAAQQQQQQLENLRSLAGRGQDASTQQAGFQQQAGTTGAGITANLASQQGSLLGQLAGQQGQLGSQMAGMANQAGQFGANILNNAGQNIAGLRQGLGSSTAGVMGDVGGNLAALQNQLGGNLSNIYGNTASNVAGLRSQAGRDVANQLQSQTGQLAGNQLNLGQMLANLDTGTASQLAQLLTGGATAGASQQQNLAALLANLATGQGSQLAGLQTGIGDIQAAGKLAQNEAFKGGLGGTVGNISQLLPTIMSLFSGSDARLKDNITKLADGAVNIFAWTWKHIPEIPEDMRGVTAIGVIAQEVLEKFPECVRSINGYLHVNYSKLADEVANG